MPIVLVLWLQKPPEVVIDFQPLTYRSNRDVENVKDAAAIKLENLKLRKKIY